MADHSTTTRMCRETGAPSWVELVACPVLSRSCLGVDDLVAVDRDSRMRRRVWISGDNANEQYPQVPARKFFDEEEG